MEDTLNKDENQYRSMAKGTAMMGGVQVFNIIINLVRGKLVALFLGPQGMGVMSLLQSSGNMVQQISSCGLNLSSVREIANSVDNRNHIISVIRKLLLLSGILGVIAIICLSTGLSYFSFGNADYKWYYIFLSVWVLFTTLANGELSILQGAHALKRLAVATLVGSCTGLFVGVPMFYLWGEKGIVPALIASSIALFIFYKYHSYRQFGNLSSYKVNLREEGSLIKKLISLGFIYMISALLGTITTYFINSFVRFSGTVDDVGLFQAANSLTNQYAGLVFTAMSMDFFPRLSAVSSDNNKVRDLVNNQTEIVVLIVAPIVSLIILFAPLIIKILLTNDFMVISPVIKLMAVGIFFKAVSYPMGYISFSKGDKKTFFWLEGVCGNALHLLLSVLFYYFWGVVGLGVAYGIGFFVYIFIYIFATQKLYGYYPHKELIVLLLPLFGGVALSFVFSFINKGYLSYSLVALITIILMWYCLSQLNKRLALKEFLKRRRNKS